MEPFDPLDPRAYDPVDENPPPLSREPTRADVLELILLVAFIFTLIALVLYASGGRRGQIRPISFDAPSSPAFTVPHLVRHLSA